jgi:hypothetical protein
MRHAPQVKFSPAKSAIQVEGDLQFGGVQVEVPAEKRFLVRSTGTVPAPFHLEWDR